MLRPLAQSRARSIAGQKIKSVSTVILALLMSASATAAGTATSKQDDNPSQSSDATGSGIRAGETGGFEPGKGFKLLDTPYGSVNFSLYFLVRYLNQMPAEQTFTNHLGEQVPVDPRNDIQLQREMIFFTGWVYQPKLNYTAMIWTVNSTNQVAVAGNLSYVFNRGFILSGGIGGLPGTTSLRGTFPYNFGTDRQLADDFFRPGFTGGIWFGGEPVPKLNYKFMVGNNLSQIGINAAKLTRELATSVSVWYMPTTGEFGPRGGFGDYEIHNKVATRFGASYTRSRENRFSQPSLTAPDNTQIRLSDSTLFFQTGALAPNTTVNDANYHMVAVDLGLKYEGIHIQSEFYYRLLDKFDGDGPLPLSAIHDHGFYVQAGYTFPNRKWMVYSATDFIFGQFNNSYEAGGGANWFPTDTRNWRLNLWSFYVFRSAYGSLFGYYTPGQTGPTVSLATDVFF
jgi:hypothetical protein